MSELLIYLDDLKLRSPDKYNYICQLEKEFIEQQLMNDLMEENTLNMVGWPSE